MEFKDTWHEKTTLNVQYCYSPVNLLLGGVFHVDKFLNSVSDKMESL